MADPADIDAWRRNEQEMRRAARVSPFQADRDRFTAMADGWAARIAAAEAQSKVEAAAPPTPPDPAPEPGTSRRAWWRRRS